MLLKIDDVDFKRLTEFMLNKYGINLTQKRTLIEGRLGALIHQRGFSDFKSFLNMVFADKTGTEMITLLNKLTTNHTYFYREPEHYEYMAKVLLPHIEKVKTDNKFHIWSAGCSSGEEPYTNVMQTLDYFGMKKSAWKIDLLATDISMRVMNIAKEAIYSAESMKHMPATWKAKYFIPQPNNCFKVSPEVTKYVEFKTFNLMDQIPFRSHRFDLIFCRNVMIYFNNETKLQLVKRFFDVLAPGGHLFIGHAESIGRNETDYEYIKPAIYRRPL